MSWTKRQFVEQALEELGLASYEFDLQPEQMNSALIKLDAMIAAWASRGLKLNYPLSKMQILMKLLVFLMLQMRLYIRI